MRRGETQGGITEIKRGDLVPPGDRGGRFRAGPPRIIVRLVRRIPHPTPSASVHGSLGSGLRLGRHNDCLSLATRTILRRQPPTFEGIFGSQETRQSRTKMDISSSWGGQMISLTPVGKLGFWAGKGNLGLY